MTASEQDKPKRGSRTPVTQVSAPPKARQRKKSIGQDDEVLRPQAAVVFRALKAVGASGLAWREVFVLVEDYDGSEVGRTVTWMRYHGVSVLAYYEAGETRFKLE
jgi:hypothetical protein